MALTHLSLYQCRNCGTTVTSPSTHDRHERPLCCLPPCNSYMRHVWTEPITTDEERELAQRGLVWNPRTSRDPKDQTMAGDGQGRR